MQFYLQYSYKNDYTIHTEMNNRDMFFSHPCPYYTKNELVNILRFLWYLPES